MSLLSRFRKDSGSPAIEPEERTPGGSRILRSPAKPRNSPQPVSDLDAALFAEDREEVYERFFGPCEGVDHEIAPLVPHVDVYLFKPGYEGRDFCTLVTGGMSDIPMNAPPDIGHEFRRAELVFYCDEPKSEYVQLLRRYAHLAHDLQSWFWEAHTIPNGDPPTPLFADTPALDCVLLLNSIVRPDNDLRSHLILDGDPVSLLWFIPITSAECEFKLAQGVEALLDVFGQVQHPHVFTGNRRGYV